tara:strand:- start:133 stop:276 length:144 start_codon:yes stop_codon:yes gene_type:complete
MHVIVANRAKNANACRLSEWGMGRKRPIAHPQDSDLSNGLTLAVDVQ